MDSTENIGILLKQTRTLKVMFGVEVLLNPSLLVTLRPCTVVCALEVLSICLLYLMDEAPQARVSLLGESRSYCSWTLAVLGILSHHICRCDSTRLLAERWVVATQLTSSCPA